MDKITQILENVVRCKYFEADVHIKNPIKNSYQDGLGIAAGCSESSSHPTSDSSCLLPSNNFFFNLGVVGERERVLFPPIWAAWLVGCVQYEHLARRTSSEYIYICRT